PQRIFTYAASLRNGGYYNHGSRLSVSGELGYRFQPYVGITLTSAYNDIRIPQSSGQTTFWLIGPRIDVTLTNTLFITGFAQYNDQRNNVNLNARFQWRYRPASDLFIVYTDNYLPETFFVKNRALVLKFTYWWNI
ncbi:MAG: hydrolase, partial [Cytophaga sp.]|nr:hydrolase [Cytophaga sp.]